MTLVAGCPRCPAPVTEWAGTWECGDHGPVPPLWRPQQAAYDDLVDLLARAGGFPTLLPWPLPPGWALNDFGVVRDAERVCASLTSLTGTSALDGPVRVLVVVEEPGTGLGARCAGLDSVDPGEQAGRGSPLLKVRTEEQAVPLWSVSTSGADERFDRSVLAGVVGGRWLWVVVKPASAVLLLREEWLLRELGAIGPNLVEVPLDDLRPEW